MREGTASKSPCCLKIAIIGAGLGGLFTAVGLCRSGHRVTIYEKAAHVESLGAGIQVAPNATKHLIRCGILEYLKSEPANPDAFIHRWEDDDVIGRISTSELHARFGAPNLTISRADLHAALFALAKDSGAVVHFNSDVSGLDEENVAFTVGDSTVNADLIICADGVNSQGFQLLNQGTEPKRAQFAAYRGTIGFQKACESFDSDKIGQWKDQHLWIGPNQHITAYRMHGSEYLNIVFIVEETRAPNEWRKDAYASEVQNHFKNWSPLVKTLVENIDNFMKWPISAGRMAKTWYSSNSRILLLGDAVQSLPPWLAQGAAMAIEDAVVLSALLSQLESKSEISTVAQKYRDARLRRREDVYNLSVKQIGAMHLPDGDQQRDRDFASSNPGSNAFTFIPVWADKAKQEELYGHDAQQDIVRP